MKIKELEREELVELLKNNKWLNEQMTELVGEQISFGQSEEYKCLGAQVFEYHDHYSSFYLTTPRVYGGKAPEKVAGALDKDYMTKENAELYEKLCTLNAKMEDAEEWDEDRAEYDEMIKVCDKLAEGLTEQLRAWDNAWNEVREEEIDATLEGCTWIGELELEDGKIKEVLYH